MEGSVKTIYFGAGCFWCSEASFNRLKGVTSVLSGYAGGDIADPTYAQVSSGSTGHAEVVRVEYDPRIITLHDLLAVFFTIHDPTTLNRQGYDVGTEYRSIILYDDPADKKTIITFIKNLETGKTFTQPIVTEVKKVDRFYPAEADHYKFYEVNRTAPYCRIVIDPKIAKLKKSFAHLLK